LVDICQCFFQTICRLPAALFPVMRSMQNILVSYEPFCFNSLSDLDKIKHLLDAILNCQTEWQQPSYTSIKKRTIYPFSPFLLPLFEYNEVYHTQVRILLTLTKLYKVYIFVFNSIASTQQTTKQVLKTVIHKKVYYAYFRELTWLFCDEKKVW